MSTTRVVKMVSENTGDHFASEAEAQSVADSMSDKSWAKENCGVCGNAPAPLGNLVSKRKRHSGEDGLDRRGNMMASCCRLPSVADLEHTLEGPSTFPAEDEIYRPNELKQISEANLVRAPEMTTRDISALYKSREEEAMAEKALEALRNDLDTVSTSRMS